MWPKTAGIREMDNVMPEFHRQGVPPEAGECSHNYACTTALKPGRVIRVTFSLGHPGPTRFTNYTSLIRIGSREKRNCSFDDVETYKRYRVALS